jgi:hypothetical protein
VEVAAAGGQQVELGCEAEQVLPLVRCVVDVVDLQPAETVRLGACTTDGAAYERLVGSASGVPVLRA